ncbi:MAG: ferric reductase-like transmembrane domain-containing protein [Chloroflexi bacterium]|nr:ferric reductase-like transmembrane domain-containing protein [Chloroflexota bacterium]
MEREPTTTWQDRLSVLFILIIVIGTIGLFVASGTLSLSFADDAKLVWHLIRSSGIVAYLLLSAATLWGLLVSSQMIKTWSPGPVSMALHSTLSWMALLLSLTHAVLLLFDDYLRFAVHEILIPFIGPYRPEAVGLGTLAFWLIILVTLSFPLKKRIGQAMWKRLHYLSYAGFGMVSAHGLLAGTDGESIGLRVMVGASVVAVLLLLGIRMGRDQAKDEASARTAPRGRRETASAPPAAGPASRRAASPKAATPVSVVAGNAAEE